MVLQGFAAGDGAAGGRSAFHEIGAEDAASVWSAGQYERASSVSSTATMKSMRDKLKGLAVSLS